MIEYKIIDFISAAKKYVVPIFKINKWKLYKEKKQIQFSSLNEILNYQTIKLRKLLQIALNSPYYREIINSFNIPIEKFEIDDLKKFPILTKDIIRREKYRLLCKPLKYLYPNASGGSTGEPINFYQDENYRFHVWATMFIVLEMCGWRYGVRIARLWGAPQDRPSLKSKIAYYFQNTRFYDSFNMSEEMMKLYHNDMSKFRPGIIISYASSIYLLARFLKTNNITPNYPTISINTSAETLYPHMRELIEKVFNVKVFDKYGSREVSAIACECECHNGLHVFMDNVILECLDPITGKEIYDEPGELIITDLNNYGMPFIRYRIGDMGILTKEKCACGRQTQVLRRVIGRTTDNFILQDGRIIHGEYFTHLFYNTEGIKEFQFIQETPYKYELNIVKAEGFNEKQFDVIVNKIRTIIGTNSVLNIKFLDNIPKTPTGKYRFTISKVNLFTSYNQNQNK